ncbi:MAG: PQQ-binding-like beta-propeller repeat protein [Paracoccaceae bacterium]
MTAGSVLRAKWIAAAAGLVLLSACAENEFILPGERVGLREVLDGPLADRPQDEARPENTARDIALPAARANTGWTHGIGTPRWRAAHPQLSGLSPAWSVPIGSGDSQRHRITVDPVADDGRIFAIDSQNMLSAVSAAGEPLWTRDLTPARDRSGEAHGGGMAIGDGVLYVASGFGRLLALDPASGDVLWDQKLQAPGTGKPTYYDGLIYLVAGDTTAWALEAETGRIRWQLEGASDVNNVSGGPAPALTDELAIFAYGSGEVQAVFRKGGLARWNAVVAGQRDGHAVSLVTDITGGPVIEGEMVYAANNSGRLVAMRRDSGDRVWTAPEGAAGPIWPAGDSLFLVNDLGELVRLDASDGSRIWGVELPHYVQDRPRRRAEIHPHHGPILAGGQVVVASGDEVIRTFDPRDGSLLETVPLPGGATADPIVMDGTLYVVSSRGQLHAFR